jgi:hypothetical protein
MTRAFRRLTISVLAAALTLFAAAAQAGIEPSPFRITLVNRSNVLAPTSPLYNKAIAAPVLDLLVQVTGAYTQPIAFPLTVPGTTANEIPAGQTLVATIDPGSAGISIDSILSWRITARMGVDPSPFRVYALDARTATVPDPGDAPWLPAALLTEQMALYAFASPGTLIGSATMTTDLFYGACPLTDPWKNHGQYVRCVAFHAEELLSQGLISQEAADAAVSAAARSTVGK